MGMARMIILNILAIKVFTKVNNKIILNINRKMNVVEPMLQVNVMVNINLMMWS